MNISRVALITWLLLFAVNIHVAGETMNKTDSLYELPTKCDFSKVGHNASIETPCSPKLVDRFTSKFEGLLINAPLVVVWPKGVSISDFQSYPGGGNDSPLKLPVAGLSHVPDSTLGLNGFVAYEIVVVAVNQKTSEAYSGKMREFSGAVPMVRPPEGLGLDVGSTTEFEEPIDVSRKSFFNIDLVQSLRIPLIDATYTVYATLGDYKSNVLTIKTAVK